jgi:hypothetical protein
MNKMELKSIRERPTVIANNHESLYRCYSILECVLEMVKRGDSKETIFDVVSFLSAPEEKDNE